MELSIFLAKTWGIFIVILCLALLLKQKEYKEFIRNVDSELLFFYGGIIALLIGVPHVLAHNIWTSNWRVFITLLGWATLIKGISLLFIPNSGKKFAKHVAVSSLYRTALLFYLLIGIYLTYIGFSI